MCCAYYGMSFHQAFPPKKLFRMSHTQESIGHRVYKFDEYSIIFDFCFLGIWHSNSIKCISSEQYFNSNKFTLNLITVVYSSYKSLAFSNKKNPGNKDLKIYKTQLVYLKNSKLWLVSKISTLISDWLKY